MGFRGASDLIPVETEIFHNPPDKINIAHNPNTNEQIKCFDSFYKTAKSADITDNRRVLASYCFFN